MPAQSNIKPLTHWVSGLMLSEVGTHQHTVQHGVRGGLVVLRAAVDPAPQQSFFPAAQIFPAMGHF